MLLEKRIEIGMAVSNYILKFYKYLHITNVFAKASQTKGVLMLPKVMYS
jgi:hypothetical protein